VGTGVKPGDGIRIIHFRAYGGVVRRQCGSCGDTFEAKRNTAKFCSDRCRVRASRSPKPPPPAEADEGLAPGEESLGDAVRAELEAAGRLSTASGRAVLALARRIDAGSRESGASLAALVKEFRASLAEAVKGAEKTADPVDELRNRRERKRIG
jgi:hypothetical protein